MKDIFTQKNVLPMLLKQTKPFDNARYLYEMKFDGYRAIVYLAKDKTVIKSRNNNDVTNLYPELKNLYKCTKEKCILDGELIVMGENGPDFFKMQKRGRMKNQTKIKEAMIDNPVIYVAFDILYYNNKDLTDTPLIKRKEYLKKYIKENDNLIISKYIIKGGTKLFKEIKKQGLEGVVAKKMDSPYIIGKRTDLWVKFKAVKEKDFLVLGYKKINNVVKTIVVGMEKNNKYISYGEVNLPNFLDQKFIDNYAKQNISPSKILPLENIIW